MEQRGEKVVLVAVRTEDELKTLFSSATRGKTPRWSYGKQSRIITEQSAADKSVKELMRTLVKCSPETRRQLVGILEELNSLESRYPLSPKNPKRATLLSSESEE